MNASQGTTGKPCVDQVPESVAAESPSTPLGDGTMATTSDLLCCMCRQLLDEPMLLRCLHSCCRRCLKSASSAHDTSAVPPSTVENSSTAGLFGLSSAPLTFSFQQPSQSTSVCCQTCLETTRVTEAVDNAFLAGKGRALKRRSDMAACAFCSCDDEEGACTAQKASFWCGACQSTLCTYCVTGLHRKFHKTHVTTSLHEMQCGDKAIGTTATLCSEHGRPNEFSCFTCETVKCVSCTADCMAARHDMLLLSDPRFAGRFAMLKQRVAELASSVSSKSAVLQQHVDMVEGLRAARQADLDRLKANKRLAVDAIDQAYQEAEAALKDGYDELETKALELRRAAEQKLEQVRYAVDYSKQFLAADSETVALMQQQGLIVSRLQALVKILDSTPSTRDASAFIAVPRCEESTATWLANFCLPKPQLKFGELFVDMTDRKKTSMFAFTPISAYSVPMQQTWPSWWTTPTPDAKSLPQPPEKLSSSEPAVASAFAATSKPAGSAHAAAATGASTGELCIDSTVRRKTTAFALNPFSAYTLPMQQTWSSLLATRTPDAKSQPPAPSKLSSSEPAVANALDTTGKLAGAADAAAAIGTSTDTSPGNFLTMTSIRGLQTGVPPEASGRRNVNIFEAKLGKST